MDCDFRTCEELESQVASMEATITALMTVINKGNEERDDLAAALAASQRQIATLLAARSGRDHNGNANAADELTADETAIVGPPMSSPSPGATSTGFRKAPPQSSSLVSSPNRIHNAMNQNQQYGIMNSSVDDEGTLLNSSIEGNGGGRAGGNASVQRRGGGLFGGNSRTNSPSTTATTKSHHQQRAVGYVSPYSRAALSSVSQRGVSPRRDSVFNNNNPMGVAEQLMMPTAVVVPPVIVGGRGYVPPPPSLGAAGGGGVGAPLAQQQLQQQQTTYVTNTIITTKFRRMYDFEKLEPRIRNHMLNMELENKQLKKEVEAMARELRKKDSETEHQLIVMGKRAAHAEEFAQKCAVQAAQSEAELKATKIKYQEVSAHLQRMIVQQTQMIGGGGGSIGGGMLLGAAGGGPMPTSSSQQQQPLLQLGYSGAGGSESGPRLVRSLSQSGGLGQAAAGNAGCSGNNNNANANYNYSPSEFLIPPTLTSAAIYRSRSPFLGVGQQVSNRSRSPMTTVETITTTTETAPAGVRSKSPQHRGNALYEQHIARSNSFSRRQSYSNLSAMKQQQQEQLNQQQQQEVSQQQQQQQCVAAAASSTFMNSSLDQRSAQQPHQYEERNQMHQYQRPQQNYYQDPAGSNGDAADAFGGHADVAEDYQTGDAFADAYQKPFLSAEDSQNNDGEGGKGGSGGVIDEENACFSSGDQEAMREEEAHYGVEEREDEGDAMIVMDESSPTRATASPAFMPMPMPRAVSTLEVVEALSESEAEEAHHVNDQAVIVSAPHGSPNNTNTDAQATAAMAMATTIYGDATMHHFDPHQATTKPAGDDGDDNADHANNNAHAADRSDCAPNAGGDGSAGVLAEDAAADPTPPHAKDEDRTVDECEEDGKQHGQSEEANTDGEVEPEGEGAFECREAAASVNKEEIEQSIEPIRDEAHHDGHEGGDGEECEREEDPHQQSQHRDDENTTVAVDKNENIDGDHINDSEEALQSGTHFSVDVNALAEEY